MTREPPEEGARVAATCQWCGSPMWRVYHGPNANQTHEPRLPAEQLQGAVALLAIFVDGEGDCRLDHHGYCQAHGWMDASECHVARARRLVGEQP